MAPAVALDRIELPVRFTIHVERLRREARQLALASGFDKADAERVVLAVMELATNLARYGRNGRMVLERVTGARGVGIQIESHDDGPGIANIPRAMSDGYSTGGSLGNGLPAVRRLLHEFEIHSTPDGTDIVGRRWTPVS